MAYTPRGRRRQDQRYGQCFGRPSNSRGKPWSQNQNFSYPRMDNSPRYPFVPNPAHNHNQIRGGMRMGGDRTPRVPHSLPQKILIPNVLKTGWYDIVPKRLKCEGHELFLDEEISRDALASLKSHIDTRVALHASKPQSEAELVNGVQQHGGLNLTIQTKQSLESVSRRMYELFAAGGESQTLPVKICGFITSKEDIGKLLISFVQEKILPEKKQFLINYTIPRHQVTYILKGINLLGGTGSKICEMIEYTREKDAEYIFEKFRRGNLLGILLPLDRGFINNELKLTMRNVEFMINFYTLPMDHRKRISSYWERIEYCKHVHAGKNQPFTVVDFVTPEASQNYELVYYRKGFLLDSATTHNFKPNLGKELPNYPVNRGITYSAKVQTPTGTTPLKLLSTPSVAPAPKTMSIPSTESSAYQSAGTQIIVKTETRPSKQPSPPKIGSLDLTEHTYLFTKRRKVDKELDYVPNPGMEQPTSHSHTLIPLSDVVLEVEDTSDHEGRVVFDYNHTKPHTLTATGTGTAPLTSLMQSEQGSSQEREKPRSERNYQFETIQID